MIKKILIYTLVLVLSTLELECHAQNATILLDSTYVRCTSISSMTSINYKRILVLNSAGSRYANFVCTTDNNRSLKSFKCTITPMNGKKRTLGKKDISSTELSENLADDYTTHYLEVTNSTYPYMVELEYQTDYSNGYISMPSFAPAYMHGANVQKAVYHLVTPQEMSWSYKCVNMETKPHTRVEKGEKHTIWRLENLNPYKHDAFMPAMESILPHMYVTPERFLFYKIEGNSSSWEEYGKWQWGLMEGRDILPDRLKEIVHEITDTISLRREKIRALYNYLGHTTRYVSIQMGLGGLQPMTATQVYENGFGDCKALTNYLKALLKECGIESNYVEINTQNPKILRDHASVYQTNHAILKVPDPEGDLWLECTNSEIPFGFLHDGIAGHDAVVYSNGTASIETLPNYPDSTNIINSEVHIRILGNGNAEVVVNEKYHNQCSENMHVITKLDPAKQTEIIKGEIAAPSCSISNIKSIGKEGNHPQLHLTYTLESQDWISRSGNRMFIPISIFRRSSPQFNKERELDIEVRNGHTWVQKIQLELPQGYVIEGIPKDAAASCCLGSIKFTAKASGKYVNITIERKYSNGKYDAAKIGEIKGFFTSMDKICGQKIVVSKQ